MYGGYYPRKVLHSGSVLAQDEQLPLVESLNHLFIQSMLLTLTKG